MYVTTRVENDDDAARRTQADGAPADPPEAATSPLEKEQARVLDVLVRRFDAAYKWWDRAYSTAAETAVSFVGLAIIVAVLVLEAIPGSDPFDTAELIALVAAATVITLAAITGRAVAVSAAARAQAGANDALLVAAGMRKKADEPSRDPGPQP